jgi:hypothetical protein
VNVEMYAQQPWEPITFWEHGRITQKYIQSSEGLMLAYGVAWYVYGLDGKLMVSGRADSIVMAQLTVDSDAEQESNVA